MRKEGQETTEGSRWGKPRSTITSCSGPVEGPKQDTPRVPEREGGEG